MKIVRLLALILISLIPIHPLRGYLYRQCFGFRLAPSARIGMFNLMDVKQLSMEEYSRIQGWGNIFLNVARIKLEAHARIGGPRIGLNLFRGTAHKPGYPPATFKLGRCSVIELFNYFDLCSDITFGDNTVLGGIKSVFMTHTFFEKDFKPIEIGDNVFIGSNCLFQMGVSIPSNCVVGLGSVVVDKLNDKNSFIAGVPARTIRNDYGYVARDAFSLRNLVYYEDGQFVQPQDNQKTH